MDPLGALQDPPGCPWGSLRVLGMARGARAWEAPKAHKVFSGCLAGVRATTWGDFGCLECSWGPTWEVDMLMSLYLRDILANVLYQCFIKLLYAIWLLAIAKHTSIVSRIVWEVNMLI